MNDFRKEVLKVNKSRKHKVSNSYGLKDAYNYFIKNILKDNKIRISSLEFSKIIKKINNYLVDNFIKGNEIQFPSRMGKLELIKFDTKFNIENGKIKNNLPVDWDKTLKLWEEDEESYKKKTLVKMGEKAIYKIIYNKVLANYTNQNFYDFNPNRTLKLKVKKAIKDNTLDALKL